MPEYLFRISTKQTDCWSNSKPKPLYFVAKDKDACMKWATLNLKTGLSVSKITRLAERIGGTVFIGA